MPGMRRTRRCSCTPETSGSTRCARHATFGSSLTASSWRSRPRQCWSSRPAFPPGTTSTEPRWTSTISSRPARRPLVRTREQQAATGQLISVIRFITILRGHTTSRPGSCCDRRPDRLLQRARRSCRRWRTPRTSVDAFFVARDAAVDSRTHPRAERLAHRARCATRPPSLSRRRGRVRPSRCPRCLWRLT
jgi:hypothetical protein